MGYIMTKAFIGDPHQARVEEVEFLVDSGSFHPMIPPSLAGRLGIKPIVETEFILADKRRVRAPISLAYFKLLDRESVFPVVIVDMPTPLLGVTVFEGLGIKIDPVTGKLEYSHPFGLAAL